MRISDWSSDVCSSDLKKDKRALAIEEAELAQVRKDLADQQRIFEDDIYDRLRKFLLGKTADGGPNKLKKGAKIDADYLDSIERDKWFEIRLADDDTQNQLEAANKRSEEHTSELQSLMRISYAVFCLKKKK